MAWARWQLWRWQKRSGSACFGVSADGVSWQLESEMGRGQQGSQAWLEAFGLRPGRKEGPCAVMGTSENGSGRLDSGSASAALILLTL